MLMVTVISCVLFFSNEEDDLSDANFLCYFASSFLVRLEELTEGSDHWLRTCSLFVQIAKEFLTFVESYRCGDSIAIEYGYQRFVPVWRCLRQSRYLERHWRQQEEMMMKFPFTWLETLRRFRTVGRYPGKHKKGRIAMDECLELSNRFYAQFPMVRTLEAFAKQSMYIGIAIMCKRMLLTLHNLNGVDVEAKVYRSGSSPRCLAERKMIYEVFGLLKTSQVISQRRYKKHIVWATKSTVDLTDSKLESEMRGNESDEAYRLLSTIGQILDDVVLPLDNDSDDGSDSDEEECTSHRRRNEQLLNDDYQRTPVTDVVESEDISDETEEDDLVSVKLGYNQYMVTNVWNIGIEKLSLDNIPKKRQDAFIRVERKRRVNMIVASSLNNDANKSCLREKMDIDVAMPVWTQSIVSLFPHFYQ